MKPHPISKIPLFEAPALGYDQTRIPALIRTARGTLLAFCEGRKGPGGDWAAINILMRRSTDGGESWDETRVLVDGEGGPASNAVPIAGADGTVHFICQKGYSHCLYYRSEDDGRSWSEPCDITGVLESFRPEYDWEVFAPGPGHAIELRNGRLVVPLWLCDPAGPEMPGGDHRPSCVTTIASDDGGVTWQRGGIIADTGGEILNPSECAVAELGDGRVMINIRSESARHRRLVSISPDGLTGWSPPGFDDALYEPVCMAGFLAATDPASGAPVLLFSNPDSRHDPVEHNANVHFCSRSNGVIRLSRDGGQSWPEWRVIDAGPFGYSDLAFDPKGTLYCLYDTGIWGRPPHHQCNHVVLARFDLGWIAANPFTPASK